MKHYMLMLGLMASSMLTTVAQPLQTRVIDEGGTGMFKAVAVQEQAMKDFVVYRPKDLLHAHARQGALPVLIFGNGGCADTSVGYERMLTEVASHGYIVVAIGEMQNYLNERATGQTESSELMRGLDLMLQLNRTKGTDYYRFIDTTRIAAAGHSCGGAQVLYNAGDPRLKTYLILNAGMGDMEMAGASRASLPRLHAPILYIVGGPSDVAFTNAQKDYDRIAHVPVCLANHPASGHGGTYGQPYGGDYGRLVLDWLDWHLKGRQEKAKTFLTEKPEGYDGWELKAKNFIDFRNVRSLWIENGDRQIYGVLNRPVQAEGRMPIAIVSHGFNGTHHFAQDYFGPLAELGWMTYTFDFPCGSVNSRSDSNTMNMSILDERSDLRAIVNYFRRQPYVDPNRIMLIGESQGGLVSALTAAQMNKEVSHLVLIYPALCIPDNWNSRYPRLTDIPDTTRLWNVPMGRRFFEELHGMDAFRTMKKFQHPVLIIQGDADQVVSMEDSRRAAKTYKNARLHVIPGAGHGFRPKERQEATEQVRQFINATK
ncbi:MAG: alpha/beta fold hydrolase [Bacteroidaceae bacterium]|nr:alpha/beta fold hydrolase [Bacteroidaceae bacterium]